MKTTAYRTSAAFLVGGKWTWIKWDHANPNKHAAIIAKSKELDAQGHDFGQADHHEASRFPLSR